MPDDVSTLPATRNAKPPLAVGGGVQAIVPQDIEQAFRLAQAIASAGMAPQSYAKDANKIMVGILHGMEVGFTPMAALQSIAVINGTPAVWGDGALGLVRASGDLEEFEEAIDGEGDAMIATCKVKRRGESPIISTFSVADAKAAGLWSKAGPWKQYPKRMLQMRARGFALRDGFADVLKGLRTVEEVRDIPTLEAREDGTYAPAPPRPTQAEFETYPISDEAGEIVDDLSIHDWPVMFGRQLEACIAEQADVAALMQANAATLDKLRAAGANLEPLYTIYHAWRDDHPLEDEDEIAGAASSDAGDPGSGRTALDDAQASGEPVRPSPGSEAAKPGTAASTASDETEPLIPVGITEEGDADWAGWTKLFTERLEGIDSLGWLESFLAVHEKSLGNLKIAKPTWAEKMDGMIAGAQERLSA